MIRIDRKMTGAALPTVLVVSVFMLILVLAALTYLSMDMQLYAGWHRERQQRMDLFSALKICCCDSTVFDEDSVSLFLFSEVPVNVYRQGWGFYEIMTASSGPYLISRLVGAASDSYTHAAFWLCDRNRALSLAGDTRIDGIVHIPLNGINYMEYGEDKFIGDRLMENKLRIAGKELPAVLKDGFVIPEDEVNMHVHANDSILMLSCNAIVDGEDIVLSSRSSVHDILVNARKVTVSSGFRGSLQIMCSDTVIVKHGAVLEYPSGIYIRSNNGFPYVELQDSCCMAGYVIVEGAAEDFSLSHPCYMQSSSASLSGLLYADGSCNLEGDVSGAVYVKDCFHIMGSSTYPGVLHDAHISRNDTIAYPLFMDAPYRRKAIKKLH